MKLIVDAYVRLKSCKSLEDMLDHRGRIGRQLRLRSVDGFDLAVLRTAIDKEIELIEAGIAQVRNLPPRQMTESAPVQGQGIGAAVVAEALQPGASVQRDETPNSLIDAAIERLNRSPPRQVEGNAVQVREVMISAEAAQPDDTPQADDTPSLFGEYTLGGQMGYNYTQPLYR